MVWGLGFGVEGLGRRVQVFVPARRIPRAARRCGGRKSTFRARSCPRGTWTRDLSLSLVFILI